MVHQLVTSQKTNQVAGLHIEFTPNGEPEFNFVQLTLKKQIINLVKSGRLNSVDELPQQCEKGVPLVIIFDGKGILQKPFGNDFPQEATEIAKLLLPGIKVDEMYLQVEANILSFVRKATIDDFVLKLQQEGFNILNISLGPFCLANFTLATQSKNLEESVKIGGYELYLKDGKLTSFLKLEPMDQHSYAIGSESILSSEIGAYAAGFNWLMGDMPKIESKELIYFRDNFFYMKFFNKVFISFTIALFVILLVNYIFFEIQGDKNLALQSKNQLYSGKSNRLNQIRKELKEKEAFLIKAGWMTSSKLSFYADRIAASIPNSISLKELSLYPEDEKLTRDNRKLTLRPGVIQIVGMCAQPTDLNKWINELDNLKWASSVQMVSYTYDNKTKMGTFKLEVNIKTN